MTLHSTGSRGKKKRNDAEKENESPLKIQKIDAGKAVDATPLEMLASEGMNLSVQVANCVAVAGNDDADTGEASNFTGELKAVNGKMKTQVGVDSYADNSDAGEDEFNEDAPENHQVDDAMDDYDAHERAKAKEAENLKWKNELDVIVAERANPKAKAPLPGKSNQPTYCAVDEAANGAQSLARQGKENVSPTAALNDGFEFAGEEHAQLIARNIARRYNPLDGDEFFAVPFAEEGLAQLEVKLTEGNQYIPPDYDALLDDGLDITEEEFEIIHADNAAMKNGSHEMLATDRDNEMNKLQFQKVNYGASTSTGKPSRRNFVGARTLQTQFKEFSTDSEDDTADDSAVRKAVPQTKRNRGGISHYQSNPQASPTSSQSAADQFEVSASQMDSTLKDDSSSELGDSDDETESDDTEDELADEEAEEIEQGTAPPVDFPLLARKLAPRKAVASSKFNANVQSLIESAEQPVLRYLTIEDIDDEPRMRDLTLYHPDDQPRLSELKLYDLRGLPDLRNEAIAELRDWFLRDDFSFPSKKLRNFADAHPKFDPVGILAKDYTTDRAKYIFGLLTEISFTGDISPQCERLDNIVYSLYRGSPPSSVDPLVRLLFYTRHTNSRYKGNCIYHGQGLRTRPYYHEAMALGHCYEYFTGMPCHLPTSDVIDELIDIFLKDQSFHIVIPYPALPNKMAIAVESSLIECIRGSENVADGLAPGFTFGDAFSEPKVASYAQSFIASFTLSRFIHEKDVEIEEVTIDEAAITRHTAPYFNSLEFQTDGVKEGFWSEDEYRQRYVPEPAYLRPYPSMHLSIRNALDYLFAKYQDAVLELELLNYLLKTEPICKYLTTDENIKKYTLDVHKALCRMKQYTTKKCIIVPRAPKALAKRAKQLSSRVKVTAQEDFPDTEFSGKQIFAKIKPLAGEKKFKVANINDCLSHIAKYRGQHKIVQPVISNLRKGVFALTSYVQRHNLFDKPMLEAFMRQFIMEKLRELKYVTHRILLKDLAVSNEKAHTAFIKNDQPNGAGMRFCDQRKLCSVIERMIKSGTEPEICVEVHLLRRDASYMLGKLHRYPIIRPTNPDGTCRYGNLTLAGDALLSSPTGRLTQEQITAYVEDNYPGQPSPTGENFSKWRERNALDYDAESGLYSWPTEFLEG